MSTTSCCFQLVYHLTYHLALIHYHCQKREGVSLQWHQESNYSQLCILTYYYWHCRHDIMCHAEHGVGNRLVSVQPYVCPSIRPQQRRAAGLLLSAMQAEDIDRQRRAATQLPGAAARRSISSKCGQSHVDRGRLKMRDMKIRDGQKCRGGKCET